VVGLLLASTTLEGMEEAKQEDLNSTQAHLMVYLLEYCMEVRIQETDHLDKTKEDLLDKEVATNLVLDHHMDQMEGLEEIKEARVLAMVVNLLDLLVESIYLKGIYLQPLVDQVTKDLLEV